MLITGGAGFIGNNFIRYIVQTYPDEHVINMDNLTYAGNISSLDDIKSHKNYSFIKGDIADPLTVEKVISENNIDVIINFAAESHVDRSILNSDDFIRTNIVGTQILIKTAMKFNVPLFIQVSTDEVYGSLDDHGYFTEETPLSPNSPYSASKASADLIVRSFFKTYGYPAIITRCSNNYGPYQFPEKLIPLFITNAMHDKPLPIYGDGEYIRDWLHVKDHCTAIDMVRRLGTPGEIYNIGANNECSNNDITCRILDILKKPQTLKTYVTDRPGHDRRYAIDSSKISKELGWKPAIDFNKGLEETIQWYVDNRIWWEKIKKRQKLS